MMASVFCKAEDRLSAEVKGTERVRRVRRASCLGESAYT